MNLNKTIKKLIKDCFWDYSFNENDIKKLAKSSDIKEKQFLFEKVLLNSTDLFRTLQIFKKNDLIELIKNYKIPSFNYDFVFMRKNIVEAYYLDKPLLVDELKWTK